MKQAQAPGGVKKAAYRTVRLTTTVPGARQVHVTGDFLGWAKDGVPMAKVREDIWETTLDLAPGEYQYRLLVDGNWQDHPQAKKRVPNPFGSENCVLEVR